MSTKKQLVITQMIVVVLVAIQFGGNKLFWGVWVLVLIFLVKSFFYLVNEEKDDQ